MKIAVIPAHNEEETIKETIEGLLGQTDPLDLILVMADNCSDDTIERARSIDFVRVMVRETVDNKYKKAGAINQGLCFLQENIAGIDFILLMDADTILAEDAVEAATKRLIEGPGLAAVCSRAGVKPWSETNATGITSWFLHRLQRAEYALYDSQRVETWTNIKVVHGMAALHRWEALVEVGFYDAINITEDYELTLSYKEAGWRVSVDLDFRAWTEVPTSLADLWKQRVRWYRGGVDALRDHGWNEATSGDIMAHVSGNLMFVLLNLVSFLFIVRSFQEGGFHFSPVLMTLIALNLLLSLYRLKYIGEIDILDVLIKVVIVPDMLFSIGNYISLWWSYFLSFSARETSW